MTAISTIAIIITCLAGSFLGMMFIIRYIRTSQFRINAKSNDVCKFYIGEIKYTGKILRRIDDRCYVAYLSDDNEISQEYFYIDELYPAW